MSQSVEKYVEQTGSTVSRGVTGGSFVLDGQLVDLQRRVGSVASEPRDVVESVTHSVLLNADGVVHHSDVVDREHTTVNLHNAAAGLHLHIV